MSNKLRRALLAIVLAGLYAPLFAAPAAAPTEFKRSDYFDDETNTPKKTNLFVGRYGETLAYPIDWTAFAEMRGAVELIRFYETRPLGRPYRPPPTSKDFDDFANYLPRYLIQIAVFPKNMPGSPKTLKELRAARGKELSAASIEFDPYEIHKHLGYWPPDSFDLRIKKPYGLYQLFTQSPEHFFVLTAGLSDTEKRVYFEMEAIRSGLRDYMEKFLPEMRKYDLDAFEVFDDLWARYIWYIVCGFAFLLAILPSPKMELTGLSIVLFAHAFACYAWLSAIALTLLKSTHLIGIPLLLIFLALPWLSRALSKAWDGTRLNRVFWSVASLSALLGLFMAKTWSPRSASIAVNEQGARTIIYASAIIFLRVGAFFGLCFGLAHRRPDKTIRPSPSGEGLAS